MAKKKVLTAEEKQEEQRKVRKVLKRLSIKLVVYGLLAILILKMVLGIYQIHDNDMAPSLRDGDLIITYKLGGYHTGDVVVFKGTDGKTHYGRVVAVAGDTINIVGDGYYEINGSIPRESIYYPTNATSEGVKYPLTIPSDTVFIMGDMRLQATDSRELGPIAITQLKGKVVLLLFRGRGF